MVEFSERTNRPAAETPEEIGRFLNFSAPIAANYRGIWAADTDTLAIEILSMEGFEEDDVPDAGTVTVTVVRNGALLRAADENSTCVAGARPLTGSWVATGGQLGGRNTPAPLGPCYVGGLKCSTLPILVLLPCLICCCILCCLVACVRPPLAAKWHRENRVGWFRDRNDVDVKYVLSPLFLPGSIASLRKRIRRKRVIIRGGATSASSVSSSSSSEQAAALIRKKRFVLCV